MGRVKTLKKGSHARQQFSRAQFPVHGLQQPQLQLVGRGGGCCRSEFSDIWWAVVYGQKRPNVSQKRGYLYAYELVY